MAKEIKNLPIDYKWKPELGAMGTNHSYFDGEYTERAYEHQEFPKVKYHADFVAHPKEGVEYSFTELPQTVNNREEEQKLGDDWKDSPGQVGVITAPDLAESQKRKRAQAATGSNWRAAVAGNNADATEQHLKFLQSEGGEAKTMADLYNFLAGLTGQQMKSFMKEAKDWISKQEAKKK